MRIGHGYDVHQLADNRDLILGGVRIPFEKGLLGFSDADVLLHAICDALLGAAGQGDIGLHFPDDDPQFKGIDSRKLLGMVCEIISREGFQIVNIDATIVAEKPKLRPFMTKMIFNVADTCQIPVNTVNIKATTEEGLGFSGKGEGIAAHCVCLLL